MVKNHDGISYSTTYASKYKREAVYTIQVSNKCDLTILRILKIYLPRS